MERGTIQEGEAAGDLAKAQTQLWNLMLSYIDSMMVRCAVELGIPDAIHDRGGRDVSVPELMAALSIPASGGPRLSLLMRILCRAGFLTAGSSAAGDGGTCYSLTDVSRLVLRGSPYCHATIVLMDTGRLLMEPFRFLSAWFRRGGGGGGGGEPTTAFELAHGRSFWDMVGRDREFGETFNEAMSNDSCLLMDVLIKECGHVFRGLRSLVDVGGGTGSAARAISEAFPELKCTVLDLPHVVSAAPAAENATVEFVAGDMFDYIPPADAVMLKWILHNWKDEDCVRILQRCKEAIPAKEEGGKVIIIDMVVIVNAGDSQQQSIKAQLNFDMLMAVLYGGIEREEHEWRNIFEKAGFSGYKIFPATDTRCVIEAYP